MDRKTKTILLCLLGTVAMAGSCACCCGWWDEMLDPEHRRHGGHVGGGSRYFFFSSSTTHVATNTGPHSGVSSTSRGGFGATGTAASGGGA
jgi:hypothetical protein